MDNINKLPKKLNGNDINSDFRVSIQFENLLLDKKLDKVEKTIKSLELYYPKLEILSKQ